MQPIRTIFAGGRERWLSKHVLMRIRERNIPIEWIIQAINSPAAIEDDEFNDLTNYYGFVGGNVTLLVVPISKKDDQTIPTAFFDEPATRKYLRGDL
jgi:hypothetical protein